MKKIVFILGFILSLQTIFAQVPGSFRYQAVVRDATGELLINKSISLRISVLEGSATSEISVYTVVFEGRSTNDYGIIAVNIGVDGDGVTVGGNFSTIDWGTNSYYLKVEVDVNGSSDFVYMGTSQILAVPYSLYSLDTKNKDDADADPGNEIQDLQLIDNVLTITNNDFATEIPLSQYVGVDTDDQSLYAQVIGNTVNLTIDDGVGTSFNLPSDFVSRLSGGTFEGPIYSTNFQGLGSLSLQGDLTISGTSPVQLSSQGSTSLTLPTSGTLATQAFVTSSINTSNSLPTGNILVGVGGLATPFPASGTGQILIGNGSGIGSFPLSGDATMSTSGILTLSNTTVNPGTYFSTTVDSKGRVTNGTNPTTIAGFGITDALDNSLSNGRILIGEAGIATEFDIRGDGQIVIGNGVSAFSRAITGDITLLNSGAVTVNSIGNDPIGLEGSFQTRNDDIELTAGLGGSIVTLPQTGTLANQAYVNTQISNNNSAFTGSTSITTLGTISTGVWNAGAVTSSGVVTGTSIVRVGGTSSQFLKADGSVDANIYLTNSSGVSSISGTLNQINASGSTGDVTLSLPSILNGLTSVTSTSFVGDLIGNSSSATALLNGRTISITGDLVYTSPSFDGAGNVTAAGTLATVNSNIGSFGSSSLIPTITVNGKGLVTGVSTNAVVAPAGTLTGTTLANTVVTSSLTSVGTLTTGVWDAGSVTSSGAVTGTSIIRAGGTSNQFLKADGSVDANTYLTASSAVSSVTGTANQILASGATGDITLSLPTVITGLSSVTSTTFVGALSGNANTASSTPAENLTGTALAGTVTGSSLTSVGTITTGTWDAGAVTSSGVITGVSIVRTGGSSNEFLKADGSVDSNTYLTAIVEAADDETAIALQTSFTLSNTPSANSIVKMYINGVRVSNANYSVSVATVTYTGPALTGGENVQFDYYY